MLIPVMTKTEYSPKMLASILACAATNLVLGPPIPESNIRAGDPDHDRFAAASAAAAKRRRMRPVQY